MAPRTTRSLVCALLLLVPACVADDDPVDESAAAGRCPDVSVLLGEDDPLGELTIAPADESLRPIVIGFVNPDQGFPVTAPGSSTGFDAAVELANACLGGIDGHPLEVDACNAGDDATIQACAVEMASTDDVHVVAAGLLPSSAPLYPVLEPTGKVVALMSPTTAGDLASRGALALYPGPVGVAAGLPTFAAEHLDADQITVLTFNDEPGLRALEVVTQAATAARVDVVPVTVGAADLDYSPFLAATPGAVESDAVVAVLPGANCGTLAASLELLLLDAPVVTTSACANPAVIEQSAGRLEGWFVGFDSVPPGEASVAPAEARLLRDAWRQFGEGDVGAPGVVTSFGLALALWEVGRAVGFADSSPAVWAEALRSFPGPVLLGPRQLRCGVAEALPSLCGSESRVFEITESGLVDATDGEPVTPFER
ncbi:MAG: ABC transporter substrate-binding protein [Acidimicrobiales bacterium]